MPDLVSLHNRHPDSELIGWARQLRFFRFCAAPPKEDGDKLLLALRFDGFPDLLELFRTLGIVPRYFDAETQPPAGQGWASAQAYRSVMEVQGLEPLMNPGWTEVRGTPAHVSVSGHLCKISLQNPANIWEVTAADVARAAALEGELAVESERFLDPPSDNQWCLCPKYFPWVWE